MTIAIAIRTGSAVVFAADSKLTTSGFLGFDQSGDPIFERQTYDNFVKVVHDQSQMLMAMVAGDAGIGKVTVPDFIATRAIKKARSIQTQDRAIEELVKDMVNQKRAYWEPRKIPPENWPDQTVLFAAPAPDKVTPRVWRIELLGADLDIDEILVRPGMRLEGAYDEVFGLLYGYEPSVLSGIADELTFPREFIWEVVNHLKVLKPIGKLNLLTMPTQDAIDLAVFLAEVQIQMDRFLPGTPACGGPIDVMVLQMAPKPGVLAYPGKVLHHPGYRG